MMTQEEKAKAYDKALKVLHKYDGANIMFSQSLKEEMFPELKESEDKEILEKQGEQKHKFNIGDIISNGQVVYRVDNITKNCIGQNCYFLVNVESEKNGTRYLTLTDSGGKRYNVGEITLLCEQVDKSFEKQGESKSSK